MTGGSPDTYDAAGGVVFHGRGLVLVLHKPSAGEVRLPKGHVEEGESFEAAAVREVAEESGYTDVEVVADLGVQLVEFDRPGRHVRRREHSFAMRLLSAGQAPQAPGDDKFSPAWMPVDEAEAALTFEVEREWVRRAVRATAG